MAMPPGGGSAWHHTSDSYQMLDDSGAVWGMASTPLDRSRLTLTLRSSHSHHDFFSVLEVAAEEDGSASFAYHHPALPEGWRRLTWSAGAAPAELVPYPAIRQRGQFGRVADDAPVIATVLARPDEVTVLDGRAVARLHLRLGGDADPAWPAAGERDTIRRGGVAVAAFYIPTGPDTPMRISAVSLP